MSVDQPCRFECYLPKPRDKVFTLLVDHPERWWQPIAAAAVGDVIETAAIAPHPGGVCEETSQSGKRKVWGTILSIERPLYVRLAWQLTSRCAPIMDSAACSRVMITLRDAGEGTRVEIVHSDFIRHGDDAQACHDLMCSPEGWPSIMKRLEEAAKSI
ncbi:SRPBCC domain-containing protein [Roseibium sp.]|uniref:SRPBCC domain-containing protein n=1 Tax=Roseibium sp. TaxID=1936156 RepID=UPI003A975E1D